MVGPLPQDYYRRNFLQLLDFVADRYWPLLNPEEQHFYETVKTCSVDAQCLYVRLLSRRGPLFRHSKLHYPEIDDIDAAARELASGGLLLLDPVVPPEAVTPLFSKAEIAALLSEPALARKSRSALLESLQAAPEGKVCAMLLRQEQLLAIPSSPCFTSFQLCFFGNLRQDLSDFVLRDLGLQRYEDYALDGDHRPFHQREQIDAHLHYYQHLEAAQTALAGSAEDILALWRGLPRPAVSDTTLERRIDRLTNTLARQLERLGELEHALTLYESSRRPPARERRARIHVARGEIDRGLQLCEAMAAAPLSEEESLFAADFGQRTARQHGRSYPPKPRYRPPEEHLTLKPDDRSVELATARALATTQGPCYYVENQLFNGVLGLLIWDIVFAPVPGAFFNPFQRAPADFYEPEFTAARATLLEERLRHCQDPSVLRGWVMQHWSSKHGLNNPLVHWPALSNELLSLALEQIPTPHWQSIFKRQLRDLRHHRSGLPDLVVFPESGGYELIEVKAPGDRLQKNQQRWMAFFADAGIPHRVVHVHWTEL